jgi:hypothetical protein
MTSGRVVRRIIDVSKFTIVKIFDKRWSPSGVEYKCELESLCLPAHLMEKAQMKRVYVQVKATRQEI